MSSVCRWGERILAAAGTSSDAQADANLQTIGALAFMTKEEGPPRVIQKTATVRDLRNHFRRISQWLEMGETVQVLKHRRLFARLVPVPQARTFVGACPSPIPLPADVDDPVVAGEADG
jgi:antitoxin (DNA-binding transcriptional repressor) of toxin-antitoxin stability system